LPLKEGWEVPPDRREKVEKILRNDEVGDPILTSKCVLVQQQANGVLVVSNKGIAWREKKSALRVLDLSFSTSSKWVRWHDVAFIIPKKAGSIIVEAKKRKNGVLVIGKRGIPKTIDLKFIIKRNQKETKSQFEQRKTEFNTIMLELFKKYRSNTNLRTSDSRT